MKHKKNGIMEMTLRIRAVMTRTIMSMYWRQDKGSDCLDTYEQWQEKPFIGVKKMTARIATNNYSKRVNWCHAVITVNPALLASSYVWQIQLYFLHISLFKIIKRKYFIRSKCEFMKFLFVLLDKIKILPLYTVYLPHQLLHMLFFTPFRNFWATVFLN
jgi:hypothetical protein